MECKKDRLWLDMECKKDRLCKKLLQVWLLRKSMLESQKKDMKPLEEILYKIVTKMMNQMINELDSVISRCYKTDERKPQGLPRSRSH